MNSSWLVLALLAAVLVCGSGVIYTKHQTRQLSIELQSLQDRRDELEIEWRLLQLEESTLATASEVDRAARMRLEMVIPPADSVVYVIR
ncbi:MAG: cell division protein FtsL [Gammaproteobacteria bacterium]|nr:cell division protein FtsL [Gammaproteobacteria bacterium]MCP5423752.1 cell division protein FtsL [Gammaproteobacteria bacterium]